MANAAVRGFAQKLRQTFERRLRAWAFLGHMDIVLLHQFNNNLWSSTWIWCCFIAIKSSSFLLGRPLLDSVFPSFDLYYSHASGCKFWQAVFGVFGHTISMNHWSFSLACGGWLLLILRLSHLLKWSETVGYVGSPNPLWDSGLTASNAGKVLSWVPPGVDKLVARDSRRTPAELFLFVSRRAKRVLVLTSALMPVWTLKSFFEDREFVNAFATPRISSK